MRNLVLIISFLFSFIVTGQEISRERTKSYKYSINDNSLVYDKESGEKIEMKNFKELVEKYPNSIIVPKEEDKNGNPISYYFLKDGNRLSELKGTSKVQIKREDIYEKLFDLQSIHDKKILVILQLDLEFPMINVERIKEAEDSALKREDCVSVILTTSEYSQAKKFATEQGLKSIIIPNAKTIMDNFNFKRFPMYVILNKDKSINSELKYHYEVEEVLSNLD